MKYDICLVAPGSDVYEKALAFAYTMFVTTHNTRVLVRPEMLAVAHAGTDIAGTMGLVHKHNTSYFFEQCDPPHAFERLAPGAPRTQLAELSRFTLCESLSLRTARGVAEALTACILYHAYTCGIRHIGFVGKQNFVTLLTPLGITSTKLGTPAFTDELRSLVGDYATQKNLFCFGFNLTTAPTLPETTNGTSPLQEV